MVSAQEVAGAVRGALFALALLAALLMAGSYVLGATCGR